jgi:hypothetical protein
MNGSPRWMAPPLGQLGVVALPLLCVIVAEETGASMFIAASVAGFAVRPLGMPAGCPDGWRSRGCGLRCGILREAVRGDLAEHLMENLWFFAANGYLIVEDINDRNIPGTERFSSLRHADDPVPLSFVEQYTLTEASAELAIAANNGVLALQALGLGGWIYDGLNRLSVLGGSGDPRAPGLDFVADDDERWPFPNVTGLPGYFETLSPPNVPSVAAGVEKLVARKYGPGGPFNPDTPGPWSDTPEVRASALSPEGIQEVVTIEASYIFDTFGKLPGTVPTVHMLMYLQAQHLDTDFYHEFFAPGAYLQTHAGCSVDEPLAGRARSRQGMAAGHHARSRSRAACWRDGHRHRTRRPLRACAGRKPDGHAAPRGRSGRRL